MEKHTKGKVKAKGYLVHREGKQGTAICSCILDYKTAGEAIANTERIVLLWNAAEWLSTDSLIAVLNDYKELQEDTEAMYKEHEQEMQQCPACKGRGVVHLTDFGVPGGTYTGTCLTCEGKGHQK